MTTYRNIQEIEHNDLSIITVGTFDGVHCGHQSIIARMKKLAEEVGGRTVVVTFDPHPQIVLNKSGREPIKLLSSISERLRLLSALDVDACVIIPFTFEFAQTPAEEFITEYINNIIGVNHFLIGYDHSFGKDRAGNDSLLQTLSTNLDFTVEIVPPLMFDETRKVSSTQIRTALKNGDILAANSMLGYEYVVEGIVVEGDGRGRRLGYPTANIESMEPNKLLPMTGVYLVSAVIDGNVKYGMANLGTRPTFTDDLHPRLEVHFFDVNSYLYDRRLIVNFHNYIRPEMKFEGIDMFWSQLRDDRDVCEELISKRYQEPRNDVEVSL